jgi:Ni,Fe-hydrogenase I large subunit
MKKGPLSKKEKTKILSKVKSFSSEQIAKSLDRSSNVIEKFIKSLETPLTEEKSDKSEKPTIKKMQESQTGSLYAKNKERGVVVMTQAASMASDEKKSKRDAANGINAAPRYQSFIHQIRGEE